VSSPEFFLNQVRSRIQKEKDSISDSIIVEKALKEAAKHAKKLAIWTKTKFITRRVKIRKTIFSAKCKKWLTT